jgi:hypothetical protein
MVAPSGERSTRGTRLRRATARRSDTEEQLTSTTTPHRPLRDAVRLLKRWRSGHELPLISYALEVLGMHTRATRRLSTPAGIFLGVLDGVGDGLLLKGVHLPDLFPKPGCADPVRVFDPADRNSNLTASLDEEDAEDIANQARFTLGKLRRAVKYPRSAEEIIAEAFGEEE